MRPNQLYVRRTQLGGKAVIWLFAIAAAWAAARIGLALLTFRPRVLGLEAASSLFVVAVLLLPPVWAIVTRARRRFVARGLQPDGVVAICRTLLGVCALWGVIFPGALAAEISLSEGSAWPSPSGAGWLYLAYAAKMLLALNLGRIGFQGLRDLS